MILIQSDMFKTLWFVIYAIAALTSGSIQSASIFCQISGFFTAFGIELSGMNDSSWLDHPELTIIDFAVVLIASHSALYIFNPPASIGEGGLYPYRYFAYFLWIALPLLLASLAFTNPTGAYKSGGTSCQLPARPFWYKLALSWVPRYLIFITILSTDVAIYFYVRYKFGSFGTNASAKIFKVRDSAGRHQGQNRSGKRNGRFNVPPAPPLARYGFMPEARQPSIASWAEPNDSCSNEQAQFQPESLSNSSFKWTMRSFPRPFSRNTVYSNVTTLVTVTNDGVGAIGASASEITATAATPTAALTSILGTLPLQTSWTNFAARSNPHPPSEFSVLSFLRRTQRQNSFSSEDSVSLPQLELVDSGGHNLNEISLRQTHRKIRRQLRFLFIYPLAYMTMWAPPFISNVLQYNDYFVANPPFVLSAIVTVITVSQSAVDCWIFNIKEKPWRQSVKSNGSVGRRLADLNGLRRLSQLLGRGGKSKGAMEEEARFAYQRRDEERATRVSEIGGAERRERSWWDEVIL